MSKKQKSDTAPRLYENNFLETLSRCPFWLPPIIYLPIIIYFIYEGFSLLPSDKYAIGILVAIAGLVFWTLTEYLIHRFIFHFKPTSKAGKRFIFVVHGVHHDHPNDLNRLVFPVTASLPLAVLMFFLFKQIAWNTENYHSIFYAFFLLGYLSYDMIHYATHALSGKSKLFTIVKKHHMNHHFLESNSRYGISSGLWDVLFGSKGKESKAK